MKGTFGMDERPTKPKSMARSGFFGQPVQAEVNGNLCPVAIYYTT